MTSRLSLKQKIGLEVFRKYRSNAKKIHELDYLFWECTLRCNINCLHCGSDCTKEADVPDMPLDDFLKVLDDIKYKVNPNKTMLVLTGGEPLLRKDLEIAGKEFYNRGFPWGFVSNGIALTASRLNGLLKSGLRSVTISLDGLKDSHNWLRNNKKGFDKAVQAIGMLTQVEGIKFDVVTCVNQRNIGELQELKDLLIKNGVKEWRIFSITPIGRAKDYPDLQLKDSQLKEVMDFMAKTREESEIKVSYGCEGYLGAYEGKVRDNFFFCRAGITVGSVLVDGSISACPNLRSGFIQGNIYKDSFSDVWENKYQLFRDREWMRTGKCKDCKSFKYCDGNGMHLRDEETGEVMVCHLEKLHSTE